VQPAGVQVVALELADEVLLALDMLLLVEQAVWQPAIASAAAMANTALHNPIRSSLCAREGLGRCSDIRHGNQRSKRCATAAVVARRSAARNNSLHMPEWKSYSDPVCVCVEEGRARERASMHCVFGT
jgi:hypothetical protein